MKSLVSAIASPFAGFFRRAPHGREPSRAAVETQAARLPPEPPPPDPEEAQRLAAESAVREAALRLSDLAESLEAAAGRLRDAEAAGYKIASLRLALSIVEHSYCWSHDALWTKGEIAMAASVASAGSDVLEGMIGVALDRLPFRRRGLEASYAAEGHRLLATREELALARPTLSLIAIVKRGCLDDARRYHAEAEKSNAEAERLFDAGSKALGELDLDEAEAALSAASKESDRADRHLAAFWRLKPESTGEIAMRGLRAFPSFYVD